MHFYYLLCVLLCPLIVWSQEKQGGLHVRKLHLGKIEETEYLSSFFLKTYKTKHSELPTEIKFQFFLTC